MTNRFARQNRRAAVFGSWHVRFVALLVAICSCMAKPDQLLAQYEPAAEQPLPGEYVPIDAPPAEAAANYTTPQTPVALPSYPVTPQPPLVASLPSPNVDRSTAEPQSDLPPAPADALESGDLIAIVGTEHILAGEMFPFVDSKLKEHRSQIRDSEYHTIRGELVRQALKGYIPTKILYLHFLKEMAGKASTKQVNEQRTKVMSQARKIFYTKRIPQILESNKVEDLQSLQVKLEEKGFSIQVLEKQFIEGVIAQQAVMKNVPEKPVIALKAQREAYDREPSRWTVPARAKWRQLTARYDNNQSKEEAYAKIAEMGNRVYLGGQSFESVAKQSSEGFTAQDGGTHDWTKQGSLKSKALDAAIFSIPLGRLSRPIEDETGYHIIEVLEREDGKIIDFAEAQVTIRKELEEEKKQQLETKLQEKAMTEFPVWSRWPDDIPGALPLTDAVSSMNDPPSLPQSPYGTPQEEPRDRPAMFSPLVED